MTGEILPMHFEIEDIDFSNEGRYKHEFEELKLLGKGYYGEVYKVWHLFEEKNYAIKIVNIKDFSEEQKKNSLKETVVMAKLQNDNIIQYKASWIENHHFLYIQMELCFGNLKEILKQKRNEFNRKEFEIMTPIEFYISSELFREILEGINYLHGFSTPIIHRDLKPTNIMITFGMNGIFAKIGDFGLAAYHEFVGQSHTKYLGTPYYCAPEIMYSKYYDTKSDMYSMGATTQQLFDFDLDSFSGVSIESKMLKSRYHNIYKNIIEMMQRVSKRRPSCQQLLNDKRLWYLSIDEIENDLKHQQFDEIPLREQSIERCFSQFFIKMKQMYN